MGAQKRVTTELVNTVLAFDDSEVSGVVGREDGVWVLFSAAHVHRSDAATGREAGDGYEKAVEFQLYQTACAGCHWHIGPTYPKRTAAVC